MRLALRYEGRSAPGIGAPWADLYETALDQCAWADERGWYGVRLAEHHGTADGYIPSPLTFASAIAARTRHLRIRIGVLLLPLHDPVHIAEQAAVVDQISRGRLEIVFGMGYRGEEFALFGRDKRRRVALMEEAIETVKAAWSGEALKRNGVAIRVTPRPYRSPRPPVIIGGSSAAAARRAARIGDGWDSDRAELADVYRDECARLGRAVGDLAHPSHLPQWLHVTDDPERDLPVVGPFMIHELNTYTGWSGLPPGSPFPPGLWGIEEGASLTYPLADVADLRRVPAAMIVTPDECLAFVRRHDAPRRELRFRALVAGLPPDLGWSSLELFDRAVLPTLCSEGLIDA